MSTQAIVSDWHLNRDGLWENQHGWVCRKGHASERSRGMVWIGYRGEHGEVWAPDLETLMQRVDRVSGAHERLGRVSAGLVPTVERKVREESWTQLQLGEWPEAA